MGCIYKTRRKVRILPLLFATCSLLDIIMIIFSLKGTGYAFELFILHLVVTRERERKRERCQVRGLVW